MTQEELDKIYAIQDYFNSELQKHSDSQLDSISKSMNKLRGQNNIRVRQLYRADVNFFTGNKECKKEIKLLLEMKDFILKKSSNSTEVINILFIYYSRKLEDVTENIPRQLKMNKFLIYMLAGFGLFSLINYLLPQKDAFKFIVSVSGVIVLSTGLINISTEVLNSLYFEYDTFATISCYKLILDALNLAKEEVTNNKLP